MLPLKTYFVARNCDGEVIHVATKKVSSIVPSRLLVKPLKWFLQLMLQLKLELLFIWRRFSSSFLNILFLISYNLVEYHGHSLKFTLFFFQKSLGLNFVAHNVAKWAFCCKFVWIFWSYFYSFLCIMSLGGVILIPLVVFTFFVVLLFSNEVMCSLFLQTKK